MRLATRFAAFAAHSDDLPALEHEICRVAAEGLGVTFAKLLVYDPEKRDFLLQAGAGWPDGIVGTTRLDADVGTAAGFAWHSGKSIISNSLTTEGRFRAPAILAEHEIIRSINVVVPGDAEAAFGVLEVESPEPGRFIDHDVSFLELLAQSLAATITRVALRTAYEEQTKRSSENYQMSLHELQHRVRNDLQVIYSVVNREGRASAEPAEVTGFGRIGRRVMGLAQLYDHLLGRAGVSDLGQDGGGDIDMGIYLHSLCDKIAVADDLSIKGITLNANTEPLMMPVDRAVRLGVAVNELVTNAIKHAFPDKISGRITVRLIAKGKDGLGLPVVSVADNGCGFSGPRLGSAGMTFVEELTRQARGVLSREHSKGTFWRIQLSK